MNIIGDHHALYIKADVLLLADVFEKFINTYLKYHGLDPCHDFSSPGLSLDAMLKMTGIELKLISDNDMDLFIEKGIRGDILKSVKDLVKQIINTWQIMTVVKKVNSFFCF